MKTVKWVHYNHTSMCFKCRTWVDAYCWFCVCLPYLHWWASQTCMKFLYYHAPAPHVHYTFLISRQHTLVHTHPKIVNLVYNLPCDVNTNLTPQKSHFKLSQGKTKITHVKKYFGGSLICTILSLKCTSGINDLPNVSIEYAYLYDKDKTPTSLIWAPQSI